MRHKSEKFSLLLYLKIIKTKKEYDLTLSDACRRHNLNPTSFPSLKRRAINIIKKYAISSMIGEFMNNLKRFKIGGVIVLEDLNIRHIRSSKRSRNRNVRTSEKLYHAKVMEPMKGIFITENCDNMDSSGFCMGHAMSREEFVSKYCGGIEPPSIDYSNE